MVAEARPVKPALANTGNPNAVRGVLAVLLVKATALVPYWNKYVPVRPLELTFALSVAFGVLTAVAGSASADGDPITVYGAVETGLFKKPFSTAIACTVCVAPTRNGAV